MSRLLMTATAALFLILGSGLLSNEFIVFSYDKDQTFDKEACEHNCRRRFGGEMLGLIDGCMQECENRYWKDFDRRMRDLEKSVK